MVKLSDYIVQYLVNIGVKHTFVIQGGAVVHLIDSIEKNKKIKYITSQHEQACAMAADTYSRTGDSIGVAIATSGPGATNLITGIANAYYDSIPVLFITGNVASFRRSTNLGVRQYGFQETDIVDIVKSITKLAVSLDDPSEIEYILDHALYQANHGRKGPVLIDIPDDFQRTMIDTKKLKKFFVENIPITKKDNLMIHKIEKLLSASKRPVLIYGNGVLSSDSLSLARQVSKKLNIPTLYTWPLKGIFDYKDNLNFGSFGTNSLRSGNFIVQNSDLLIVVGTRLDTHATGKLDDFAREAEIILIDIDNNELKKFEHFSKNINLKFCIDSKEFLQRLYKSTYKFNNNDWLGYCSKLKEFYSKDNNIELEGVSPKCFFHNLSSISKKETIFVGDTGANLVYLLNGLKEKEGQQFISAFNNTPMGFALPASIGACLATTNKDIFCCVGDGGLQMNIQELASVAYYNLNIVIVVFNNSGHGMIKQTQDDWLGSSYSASSNKNGIPSLDFASIGNSYGIKSIKLKTNKEVNCFFEDFKFTNNPLLIELVISEKLRINPMLQYGRPIEDTNPLLDREEFLKHMIINPLDISKEV